MIQVVRNDLKKAISDKDRASSKTVPKPPKRKNRDSDEVATGDKETRAKAVKKKPTLNGDASADREGEVRVEKTKVDKIQKKRLTSADGEPKVTEKNNAKTTSKTKVNTKKKMGWWSRNEGPKTI